MNNTTSINAGIMTNPVIRRVAKKGTLAQDENRAATYSGVVRKTVYFLMMTFVGIIAFFAVKQFAMNGNYPLIINETIENGVFTLSFTAIEALVFAGAALVTFFRF